MILPNCHHRTAHFGQTITIEQFAPTYGIQELPDLPVAEFVAQRPEHSNGLIGLFGTSRWTSRRASSGASDSGYVLPGAIIERWPGMRYAGFIQRRIFTTGRDRVSPAVPPPGIIPGRVAGYSRASWFCKCRLPEQRNAIPPEFAGCFGRRPSAGCGALRRCGWGGPPSIDAFGPWEPRISQPPATATAGNSATTLDTRSVNTAAPSTASIYADDAPALS